MDFDFTAEQQALRDAVARWVDKGFPFERRQRISRAGGATRAVLTELAGLGLTGLTVPQADGGLGFGAVEAMVVMEELGRGLVNAPYAHAALITPALLAAAPAAAHSNWPQRVADGSALIVLAHQEPPSRYRLAQVQTRARRDGEHWSITGAKSVVPAGDEADAFIVPARSTGADDDEAGIGLYLVERGHVRVRAYPTQDGARAAEVVLQESAATLLVAEGYAVLEAAIDVGLAAQCAEAVGLMDRLLVLTADYLNTRRQFGVPIASFQALRHRMADVKMQLELARSMSYFATLTLDRERAARRRAISQACVQLGQSMRFVGQQCIQLHGGIGVTDEHLASHLFKRLTMLELNFGDTLHHLGEVSARMQDTAGVFA
jgi:alkylation response protein AidB-like acyl-CoA dehydrogenase